VTDEREATGARHRAALSTVTEEKPRRRAYAPAEHEPADERPTHDEHQPGAQNRVQICEPPELAHGVDKSFALTRELATDRFGLGAFSPVDRHPSS
jgi:hypothetical protein